MPNTRPESTTPPHCDRKRERAEIPGLSSYSVLPEMSVWYDVCVCVCAYTLYEVVYIYVLYMSTVNRVPLCKYTMCICCITLL